MHPSLATTVRVLLVEDNPADAEILTEVLAASGNGRFCVEWVERAGKGADRLKNEPRVDVAIVDLKLPDADGLEALERLLAAAPGTPVFVMTGFEDDELAREAKRRGAAGFLVKGRVGGDQLLELLGNAAAAAPAKPAGASL
jgi:DNA-binding NarL/FixJ family response regulator